MGLSDLLQSVSILEEVGALAFVLSTGLMLLFIRLIGETFGDHIAVFLPCMFALQVVGISLALAGRKLWQGAAGNRSGQANGEDAVPTAPGLIKAADSLDEAPWKHPALWIMSCLLTLNAAGVFATSKFIAGPVQTIIGSSPLVFAPLFDWLLLGSTVSIMQMAGVAVCLAGILVGLFTGGALSAGGSTNIGAALVMILAMAITPALGIMKEAWFRPRPTWHVRSGERPDILYNVLFYAGGQLPWHFLFIPTIYGPVGMPRFSDMQHNFASAGTCIFNGTGGGPGEDCRLVWWLVLCLGLITATQITTSFYVSVKKSGAYGIILAAVAPFLADAIFGARAIMGPYTEPVSVWLWLSLGLTVVGLALYRFGETQVKMTPQQRADSVSSVASLSSTWSPQPTWFLTTFLGAPYARELSHVPSVSSDPAGGTGTAALLKAGGMGGNHGVYDRASSLTGGGGRLYSV